MYVVYMVYNKVTNKAYIGVTSRSVEERWKEHISRALNGQRQSRLYEAMRKYGVENFDIVSLAVVGGCAETEEEARVLEQRWIAEMNTCDGGYNCNYGGCGSLEVPEHIREKISAKQRGKYIPLEARLKMSLAKVGRRECANNLGKYAEKGNTLGAHAKTWLVETPSGSREIVVNLKQFCRENNIHYLRLFRRGVCDGYRVLERFGGHPEREYLQAQGSGGHSALSEVLDDDMTRSTR